MQAVKTLQLPGDPTQSMSKKTDGDIGKEYTGKPLPSGPTDCCTGHAHPSIAFQYGYMSLLM